MIEFGGFSTSSVHYDPENPVIDTFIKDSILQEWKFEHYSAKITKAEVGISKRRRRSSLNCKTHANPIQKDQSLLLLDKPRVRQRPAEFFLKGSHTRGIAERGTKGESLMRPSPSSFLSIFFFDWPLRKRVCHRHPHSPGNNLSNQGRGGRRLPVGRQLAGVVNPRPREH